MVREAGGKYPNVIIEVLSDSTASTDRTLKKEIYQDIFRTPDYFWFDPDSSEFAGFHLVDGRYEPRAQNARGWCWSQQLGLFLGVSDGKLRYFTPDGERVPTPAEAALQDRQSVERQRANVAEERAVLAEEEAARERGKNARLAERFGYRS